MHTKYIIIRIIIDSTRTQYVCVGICLYKKKRHKASPGAMSSMFYFGVRSKQMDGLWKLRPPFFSPLDPPSPPPLSKQTPSTVFQISPLVCPFVPIHFWLENPPQSRGSGFSLLKTFIKTIILVCDVTVRKAVNGLCLFVQMSVLCVDMFVCEHNVSSSNDACMYEHMYACRYRHNDGLKMLCVRVGVDFVRIYLIAFLLFTLNTVE